MKKIYLISVFLFFMLGLGFSQNVYNKQYYNNAEGFLSEDICKDYSDSIYVCGNNNYNTAFVMKAGKDGGVAWLKEYDYNNAIGFNQIIYTSDSALVVAGRADDSNIAVVCKLNLNGDTIWNRFFPFSSYNSSYHENGVISLVETDDSCYLIGGNFQPHQTEYNMFLMKISPNGSCLWSKILSNIDSTAYLINIDESEGRILLSGANNKMFSGYTRPFIMMLDLNQNILWSKIYGKDFESVQPSIIFDCVMVEDSVFSYGVFNNFCYFLKMDSVGEISFSKTLFQYYTYQNYNKNGKIEVMDSSKIIIIANSNMYSSSHNTISAIIDKDGNIDHVLWMMLYGKSFQHFDNDDIIIMGNGPIVLPKSNNSNFKDFVWQYHFGLYKTDSLWSESSCMFNIGVYQILDSIFSDSITFFVSDSGTLVSDVLTINSLFVLVDDDCVTAYGGIEENPAINFVIYPNPTSNNLNISFENSAYEAGIIKIFSPSGALLYSENTQLKQDLCINVNFLPPGLYLLSIHSGEMKGVKWFEVVE